MKNIYKRQTNFITPDKLDFPILLIGCGGTGSWAAQSLVRMGCKNLVLVDFDHVEAHNIPSQVYTVNNVGVLKVLGLEQILYRLTKEKLTLGIFPKTFEEFFSTVNAKFPMVICAIDSMDERIKLWDIIKQRDDVELFLDPRIGGELLRMYAVDPLNTEAVKFYESKLYPSSKADPLPCGSRQIVYTTMFAGALIANYVKKYAKGEPIKAETIIDFNTMSIV